MSQTPAGWRILREVVREAFEERVADAEHTPVMPRRRVRSRQGTA